MTIEQAEFIIAQYGVWCRYATGVPHYKSPMLTMMRDMGIYTSKTTVAIDDDLALQVDSFLAALQKDEPCIVRALMLRYAAGLSYSDMALYGISRSVAYSKVQLGLASLAACFRTSKKRMA